MDGVFYVKAHFKPHEVHELVGCNSFEFDAQEHSSAIEHFDRFETRGLRLKPVEDTWQRAVERAATRWVIKL